MSILDARCTNCGRPATATLCPPCEQDRMLEQAQMEGRRTLGLGMPCND